MNHGCVTTSRGVFHKAHCVLAQKVTASIEISTSNQYGQVRIAGADVTFCITDMAGGRALAFDAGLLATLGLSPALAADAGRGDADA